MSHPTHPWNPMDWLERMLHRWEPTNWEPKPGADSGLPPPFPRMTTQRTESELILRLEVPGISPEDLDVTVDDQTLIIRGTWRAHPDQSDTGRQNGAFRRMLTYPGYLDVDKARAAYHQGVLEIRIPVRGARQKDRRIPIELK